MIPLLSSREQQVLYLIAFENTNQQIADRLHISCHTAITHRKNLLEKFAVRNTAGLVRRAFELGLLSTHHLISPDVITALFEMDNAVPATTILTINQDGCED